MPYTPAPTRRSATEPRNDTSPRNGDVVIAKLTQPVRDPRRARPTAVPLWQEGLQGRAIRRTGVKDIASLAATAHPTAEEQAYA